MSGLKAPYQWFPNTAPGTTSTPFKNEIYQYIYGNSFLNFKVWEIKFKFISMYYSMDRIYKNDGSSTGGGQSES